MTKKAEGVVCEIIFSNEQNGYTVCVIDDGSEEFIAVGSMPGMSPGESVCLEGEWTSHPDYGQQFKVRAYETVMPKTSMQILMYLSTGIVKGIGPVTAQKIVDRFGEKALDVIRDEPLRLSAIKGISENKARDICESFMSKQEMQNLVMFLQPYGVTPAFAVRVYRKFRREAIGKIKENPYVLCEIDGIGFKTADKIAKLMGIDPSDENRLRYGIIYVLTLRAQNGDTFVPEEELLSSSCQILGAEQGVIERVISYLVSQTQIISENIKGVNAIYLPVYYNAELGAAKRLCAKLLDRPIVYREGFDKALEAIERKSEIELSEQQRQACRLASERNVFIITGGPGTGKTTVINTIISLMEMSDLSVALCAPTGRASKRLTETCGMEAKTIHRLLEINFSDGENQVFARDESYKLDEDVIIVDEMSMVDIMLMNALLKALHASARLIMVGDADQLPSVGAGNVLRDMIDSGKIPVVRLTEIYRQAAESMIIVNAHRINAGQEPIIRKDKDFFFMDKNDPADIMQTIADLCAKRLPDAYGYDAFSDIQVISPARRTLLGVAELNKSLQQRLNPPEKHKAERLIGDSLYREGDKVMQIKNNYTIAWKDKKSGKSGEGAFNGDIGVIDKIDMGERTLSVIFDNERIIKYDFTQLEELELAYAVTVHKSQGSEFPAVVMPMYPTAPQLMNRNLLYTALTRASKLVVLVGRGEVLYRMVQNNRETSRFSGLCVRLEELAP